MPEIDTFLEFNSWKHIHRYPFTIYADFEALLVKTNEKMGKNTNIIQKHESMSYGFVVNASIHIHPLAKPLERDSCPSLFLS